MSDANPPQTTHLDRLTSRRGFLTAAAVGATGLAVAAIDLPGAAAATRIGSTRNRAAATSCMAMTPVQEVGPFYVAYDKIRSNVKGGQSGVPLELHIKVIDVERCKPMPNAALDIWQANALGVYSDEASEKTTTKTWLRGVQLTNKHGEVTFSTIMPGWYEGRVEHIHAKVRLKGKDKHGKYTGGTDNHIGQMFFPQKVNDAIAKLSPYTGNQQTRITNATDRVYTQQNGDDCVLKLTGNATDGYVGHITVGISV